MKKFLLLFWLILTQFSFSQWEPCADQIGGNNIINCFQVDGKNIIVGSGCGVFITTNNGDNWFSKPRGYYAGMCYNILSLAINNNIIFSGSQFQGIYKSSDNGESWELKYNGIPFSVGNNSSDTVFNFSVNAILINENNIYAGTSNGVYISTDNGDNWILKYSGLPQDGAKIFLYSMAVNGNKIFAGTRYGVYMSSDNGEYWNSKNTGLNYWKVFSLVTNGNNIYAGLEDGGINLSTNKGDNWVNIGLNGYTVNSIIIDRNNIITGGIGVNLSTDNGKSWTSKNSGLPDLGIKCLIKNNDYIFAGTDSSGIYRAKLSDFGISDANEEISQNNLLQIYPNPSSDFILIKSNNGLINQNIKIYNLLGNTVWQGVPEGESTRIDVSSFPLGVYYVNVGNETKMFVKN